MIIGLIIGFISGVMSTIVVYFYLLYTYEEVKQTPQFCEKEDKT